MRRTWPGQCRGAHSSCMTNSAKPPPTKWGPYPGRARKRTVARRNRRRRPNHEATEQAASPIVTMSEQADPQTLDAEELAVLEPLGTRRKVEAGEYLYREGDPAYDFYVVLSGLVEITVKDDGRDRLINTHRSPGRFLGELNLLTGSRVFLSARVAEAGECWSSRWRRSGESSPTNPGSATRFWPPSWPAGPNCSGAPRWPRWSSGRATRQNRSRSRVLGPHPVALRMARPRRRHPGGRPPTPARGPAVGAARGHNFGDGPAPGHPRNPGRLPGPDYRPPSKSKFRRRHRGWGPAGLAAAVYGASEGLRAVALFSFIGAVPASEWISGCAALDESGFVLTDRSLAPDQLGEAWTALGRAPLPFETNHPGLFAVGDVRSGSTKRVAAAVGEGSAAVRSVHQHLAFRDR